MSTENGSAGSHSRPDFLLVGHPKCGTTALYEMLRQHPAIFMPELKEPEFFASDMRRRFRPPMAGPLPETLPEYLELFADAQPGQCKGEATALYLLSQTAAQSIADVNPEARIIAVFREPASFVRSLHLQMLQNHIESRRSLRRALALEASRREGRNIPRRSYRPQILQYMAHTQFTAQLQRYQSEFPPEQILVLVYEELKADNPAAVKKILQFLELDSSVDIAPVSANPTVAIRSQALDDVVHRVSVGRGTYSNGIRTIAKAVVPQQTRRRMLRTVQSRVVYGSAPRPDDELLHELKSRLKPEVERFGDHIGRDLVSLWGYDAV